MGGARFKTRCNPWRPSRRRGEGGGGGLCACCGSPTTRATTVTDPTTYTVVGSRRAAAEGPHGTAGPTVYADHPNAGAVVQVSDEECGPPHVEIVGFGDAVVLVTTVLDVLADGAEQVLVSSATKAGVQCWGGLADVQVPPGPYSELACTNGPGSAHTLGCCGLSNGRVRCWDRNWVRMARVPGRLR